jgi:hypothetical protein
MAAIPASAPGETRPETVNGVTWERMWGRGPIFFPMTGPPAIFFRSLFGLEIEIN